MSQPPSALTLVTASQDVTILASIKARGEVPADHAGNARILPLVPPDDTVSDQGTGSTQGRTFWVKVTGTAALH
jgi:hypothetical protein